MTTYRISKNKDNPYVMINKAMLHDAKLSAKAKGILSYLLSLPDDWQIYETELLRHFTDGRDSIRSGVKELISAGYIHRDRKRDATTGQLKDMQYQVYETPINSIPITKDGFSNVGKSNTTNNDITKRVGNKPDDADIDWFTDPEPNRMTQYESNLIHRVLVDTVTDDRVSA